MPLNVAEQQRINTHAHLFQKHYIKSAGTTHLLNFDRVALSAAQRYFPTFIFG